MILLSEGLLCMRNFKVRAMQSVDKAQYWIPIEHCEPTVKLGFQTVASRRKDFCSICLLFGFNTNKRTNKQDHRNLHVDNI